LVKPTSGRLHYPWWSCEPRVSGPWLRYPLASFCIVSHQLQPPVSLTLSVIWQHICHLLFIVLAPGWLLINQFYAVLYEMLIQTHENGSQCCLFIFLQTGKIKRHIYLLLHRVSSTHPTIASPYHTTYSPLSKTLTIQLNWKQNDSNILCW
jgi:hypothetical protein